MENVNLFSQVRERSLSVFGVGVEKNYFSYSTIKKSYPTNFGDYLL